MRCCIKCFKEPRIIQVIKAEKTIGDCEFCMSGKVMVIDAVDLRDMFLPLLNLYEPAEAGTHYFYDSEGDYVYEGCSLAEAISSKDGWEVFADRLDESEQNELLDDIRYGDSSPKDQMLQTASRDWWARKTDSFHSNGDESIWNDFAEHIKTKRRFLPKIDEYEFIQNPSKWLPAILRNIEASIDNKNVYFRSRLGVDEKGRAISKDKMGAPDPRIAKRGRANPAGISYLYVAEQEKTAVAEVRPFVGAQVSVASVKPIKKLRIIDLTKRHRVESAFAHDDLADVIKRNAILNVLNQELARPINPDDSEVEYVPTQYLAEAILNCGYDGIRYKSSMHDGGTNVVFFSPSDLEVQDQTYRVLVDSLEVNHRKIAD